MTHCSDFILVPEQEDIAGYIPSSVRQRSQDELVTLVKDSPQLHAHQPRADEVIHGGQCYKINRYPL